MNKGFLFQIPKVPFFLKVFFAAWFLNTITIANSVEKTYGNFRVAKVVVKDSIDSQMVRSENLLSWDSKGNLSAEKLTVFKPNGKSDQIFFTTKVHHTVNKENQLIKREVSTQGVGFSSQAIKKYFYDKTLLKTIEAVNNKNLPDNKVVKQYIYDGNGRLKNVNVEISTDNASDSTEEHYLTYNKKGRVSSNNITRQFQAGLLMKETHTHQYDENGHIVKTIIFNDDIRETRIYLPQTKSVQLVKSELVNLKTGEKINHSVIQHFYEKGRCLLAQPMDTRSIESSIESVPYSPNLGCMNK